MNNLKNMYKKTIIVVLSILLLAPLVVSAQVDEVKEEPVLEVRVLSEDSVRVGKKIIFDASESDLLLDNIPVYAWDFGDGYFDVGEEVVHQYNKTGLYTIKLKLSQGSDLVELEKDILVYDKKALLITDEDKSEELKLINEQATENTVDLKILSTLSEDGGFVTEEKIVQELGDLTSYIKDSDLVIFYTRSSLGIQSFARYFQELNQEEKDILRKKFFVKVTDSSMDVAQNISYQVYKIVQPEFILLTREEALSPLFQEKDYSQTIEALHSRGIELTIVDEKIKKSPVWFLSHLLNYFAAKGVSANTVYLILIIPFLTFFVVLARQVVGLQTFGVYTPVMIVASFFILGIWFGLLTFLFAVLTSHIVKYILNKFELLYLPKVALNLGFISLSYLVVIWLILIFGAPISLSLAIFPMLVMSNVSEKVTAAQSEEGFRGAIFGVSETLLVVVLSYYIIIWTPFNNLVMSWPELIFVPMALNLVLAKFTGLRLGEYLRFKSLFKDHVEE